jgi:hypothetical protein
VQPLSRAREAAFLGNTQEHLELADVHRISLPPYPYQKRMNPIR